MSHAAQTSVLVGLVLTAGVLTGCGGAPAYARAAKAQASELNVLAQAHDDRLKMRLREAILADQALSALTIAPYVFMERGFVVGHVGGSEQAEAVLRAARGVSGLRSVDGYLPVRPSSPQTSAVSSTASDATITAETKSALGLAGVVVRRVSVETLDGQVVLLGVVSSEQERLQAERAAVGVNGVHGVTNWLLLPESEYSTVRPKLR
jgi:osmotically-inducible protein OsmY